jgi:lipopolysaccharide export system permease protein
MFLLLMQFLILHIDNLIGKDIPLQIIAELILTNLAYMVVLAAPMAVLVATLMAFGKFSELNELTALRASGVNPMKIMRPVIITSLLLFVGLAWFSNNVLPEANQKARSLFIDIRLKKPGFELKPNTFYDGIAGYTFLVEQIDGETDSLFNITLFQKPINNKNRAYIMAEKGVLESKGEQALSLHLINGKSLEFTRIENRTDSYVERNTFEKHIMTLDLSDLSFMRSNPNNRNKSDRTMSSRAMFAVVDSLYGEIQDQQRQSGSKNTIVISDETAATRSYFKPEVSYPEKEDSISALVSSHLVPNSFSRAAIQKDLMDESIRQMQEYQSQVQSIQSNIEWRQKRISRYLVEIHKKLSIPFACVVFILFGAPVGIMTKKGNFGFAALISTVVLTFYWVSLIQGEKLADRLFISPFWGMWTFNIVLFLAGVFLILRLTFDLRIPNPFQDRD